MTGSTVWCGLRQDGANRVHVAAPAKINVTLDVLGKRPDGYHELASLVVGTALFDELILTVADAGTGINLQCDESELPTDSKNLAWQAAETLAAAVGREPDVSISLTKRIPWGAGLGGGSSDAAATLAGLNVLWGCGLDGAALASVGSGIGSDVPLFFSLPGAFMRGRGELVERVVCPRSHVVLLVLPGTHVATGEVYGQHFAHPAGAVEQRRTAAGLLAGSTDQLAAHSFNRLEGAVFQTSAAVKALFDNIRNLGLTHIRVSGSGSAMFCLFETQEEAEDWSTRIGEKTGVETLVTRTLTADDYY